MDRKRVTDSNHSHFYTLPSVVTSLYPLLINNIGVATFVQGTVVQVDHGPRGQMSKGQLSKEILVQGDFCPRKLLPVISLLTLFFYSLLDVTILIDYKMTKK